MPTTFVVRERYCRAPSLDGTVDNIQIVLLEKGLDRFERMQIQAAKARNVSKVGSHQIFVLILLNVWWSDSAKSFVLRFEPILGFSRGRCLIANLEYSAPA